MECAARGRGSSCSGPPTRRCGRCGAVAYCSVSHQLLHWNEHREECDRFEEQMARLTTLNDFPFLFSSEVITQMSRCIFLRERGLHRIGMWMPECHCGDVLDLLDNQRIDVEYWDLTGNQCPCSRPLTPLPENLTNWASYYEWRCIPMDSPVALLLHWPLTIFRIIQISCLKSRLSGGMTELCVHYLGPEKEILQLSAFRELIALFPGVQLKIEMIGPRIPERRDGQKLEFNDYAHCLDVECTCKSPEKAGYRDERSCTASKLMIRLHRGLYHDRYTDVVQESSPHLVVAPNAGVAAYALWQPTLQLITKMNVPAIFSDYCEEACHLAARCISSVTGRSLTVPIQVNPFRQPLATENNALLVPCYSNCFLFGI